MLSRNKLRYTRCRLHGGASTGPRTPEGLVRSQRARWKHGRCSEKYRQHRKELRVALRVMDAELRQMAREIRAILRARRMQQDSQPTIIEMLR
jgi:hypothetical protein